MGSLLRRSLQAFSTALKLHPEKVFIGKDFEGNSYYEIPAQRYFLGLAEQSKPKRVVIQPNGLESERVAYSVTHEWNSWLQFKRNSPPSMTELEQNLFKKEMMAKKIQSLEQKEHRIANKTEDNFKDIKVESQTVESWTDGKN